MHRLSAEQRQKLAFLIERDPGAVRREALVALEVARQTAAGSELAVEVISPLAAFVDGSAFARTWSRQFGARKRVRLPKSALAFLRLSGGLRGQSKV
jgi:hypothetical protein